MTSGSSEDIMHDQGYEDVEPVSISMFPANGQFQTTEQIRSFELLRLALFVLKLRKLEQRFEQMAADHELEFRRNLLHHAIFQQVLTLTRLHARDQALQLIEICRK
ncbi:MAG TPA: hypothetical protein VL485_19525 [Ktedonobacteraceae bacterium]|jgi:hypothetical protein|nr:hypothetical protein [Ktedonobacteraceae bacterium]